MAISDRDIEHIFERLRPGVVPERGLRDKPKNITPVIVEQL